MNDKIEGIPFRWFDLLASLILMAALLIAASQLIATDWADGLYITWILVTLGGLLGFALGYSRFSTGVVVLLATLYGLIVVTWQLGLTLGMAIPWDERLATLFSGLNTTLSQLFGGRAVTSTILFLTLTGILAWFMSVYAGYMLIRHASSWRATIPGGIAMLIIASYGVREGMLTGLFMVYLFLALMLVARMNFVKNYLGWSGDRTRLPTEFGYNLMIATVVGAVLVFALAWFAPVLGASLPSFKDTWEYVTEPLTGIREGVGKAFAPLESDIGMVQASIVNDYYGDTLALGRGNLLSDSVILSINAPELPPGISRYYWRAHHYDYYEDGIWSNSEDESIALTPDRFDLEFPEYSARWESFVTVNPDRRLLTLFTPLDPRWVSRPVEAQAVLNSDGTAEIVALRASPPLTIGDIYSVRGTLSVASVSELRTAGTDYPPEISERYLQLSDSVTDRTRLLAEQISEGLDNPYDIVDAVTRYLRANIEYQEYLPERPLDQDPIDWMLFDLRQGFCNYYASAEVILLRSLGIPARVVVGYSQGEIDPGTALPNATDTDFLPQQGQAEGSVDEQTYIVRQRNAHAWPEVYFPGYGWIEFEPTVNQVPLVRRMGIASTNSGAESEDLQSDIAAGLRPTPVSDVDINQVSDAPDALLSIEPEPFPWTIVLVSLSVLALMVLSQVLPRPKLPPLPELLVIGLLKLGIQPPELLRLWAQHISLPPLPRAYNDLNLALLLLGARPRRIATPAERAASLSAVIPATRDPAQVVVMEYEVLTYGQKPANQKNAERASRIIRKLSIRRILGRFIPGYSSQKD